MILGTALLNWFAMRAFACDDRWFGNHSIAYRPSKQITYLPYLAGIGMAIFTCIMLFLKVPDVEILDMDLRLFMILLGLNLLFQMGKIWRNPSITWKIGYTIFTLVVTAIVFACFFVLASIVIMLLLIVFMLWLVAFVLKCLGSSARSGSPNWGIFNGASKAISGEEPSFKRTGEYVLGNGDTVEYDPLTDNYRNTNPLFPDEYKRDGDDFIKL